jgi:hypothetical protein
MTLDEISKIFSSIIIYHLPSSFKFIKTINSIYGDPNKPIDNIKNLSLLYTSPEFITDSGIIITLASVGKNSFASNLILDEFTWQSIQARESCLKVTSNGIAGTFFSPSPGYYYNYFFDLRAGYRFSVEGSNSYIITIFSKEEFYLDDEAKYLTDRFDVKIREFEDTLPAQTVTPSWNILFKYLVPISNLDM